MAEIGKQKLYAGNQRQGRRHHGRELRKHWPAAAGRLSGQRNRRGHVKLRTWQANGAKVVLGARGLERLEALARRIAGEGGEVAYARTDVRRKC
jgi:hypothetical protein